MPLLQVEQRVDAVVSYTSRAKCATAFVLDMLRYAPVPGVSSFCDLHIFKFHKDPKNDG
jgi:hypothetical protein